MQYVHSCPNSFAHPLYPSYIYYWILKYNTALLPTHKCDFLLCLPIYVPDAHMGPTAVSPRAIRNYVIKILVFQFRIYLWPHEFTFTKIFIEYQSFSLKVYSVIYVNFKDKKYYSQHQNEIFSDIYASIDRRAKVKSCGFRTGYGVRCECVIFVVINAWSLNKYHIVSGYKTFVFHFSSELRSRIVYVCVKK